MSLLGNHHILERAPLIKTGITPMEWSVSICGTVATTPYDISPVIFILFPPVCLYFPMLNNTLLMWPNFGYIVQTISRPWIPQSPPITWLYHFPPPDSLLCADLFLD